MQDLVGRDIGRYHIIEKLGEGGMASVYKAFDTHLERDVAIKIILPGFQHSESFLKRFEREAKALAQLTHPNIVPVIDYGEFEGLPYLVMAYLPGGTLKQRMGTPLPAEEVAWLLAPIAGALHYAHQYGIIHRDVKPANVLLTETGQPMLSDFGIAKLLESKDDSNLTITGLSIGTPDYMSPEQGQGKIVDARTDIYALGIVLYEMVAGRKPYRADTPMAVIVKHMTAPLPRPRDFCPDLPESVERVIFKALAKSPDDRYADMDAFRVALEKLARGKEVTGSIMVPGEQDATQVSPGAETEVDDGTVDQLPPFEALPGKEVRVSVQPLPGDEVVTQVETEAETEVDDGIVEQSLPVEVTPDVETQVSDLPVPSMPAGQPEQVEKPKKRKIAWPIIAGGLAVIGIGVIVVLALVVSQFIGGGTVETATSESASIAQVATRTLATTKFVMANTPETIIKTSMPEAEEESVVEEAEMEGGVSVILITDEFIDSVPIFVNGLRGFDRARADFDIIAEVMEGTGDPAVNEENLLAAVREDWDLIILMSWGFRDLINEIATSYPDKLFVCIDCFAEQPNVLNIGFKTHESAFLLGVAAGLLTETNIVGTVGNVEIPIMTRWTVPFADGAKFINPDVTVLETLWVGDWDDPETANGLAIALADQGADIINAVASGGNSGIFAAAEDHGLRVTGVDTNECPRLQGYIIDSNIKRYDILIYDSIGSFVAGDFVTGGAYDYGLKEGGVDLAVFAFEDEDTKCILMDHPEVMQRVREIKQHIIDGALVIPDPMVSE